MVHTSTQVTDNQAAPDMVAAADLTAAPPADAVAKAAAAVPLTGQDSSLLSAVVTLWLGSRQRLHSQLQLLMLETQRAAQSLVNMLILALFAALLLISCWLGLLGVGVLLLKSAGLSTLAALSCVLLLNLLALLTCLNLIRRQSCYLCYPASMALLKPKVPDSGSPSNDSNDSNDSNE
ncbi:hypothetical protein EOE67_05120 [Rheinheimera riviphila]|uniref:Phage holin family protein n=1 Tax=Rheinheimera riviphila TaxID=1834037 RepID=A0A437R0Z6_9GAMM|nr:hypothetical protein [Rheinheimera riviphila]RVU40434.1 hypothetical protein EOE67_05120 [Rheinheimera riviphila]